MVFIDRIEIEKRAFFERAREAYLIRARAEPDRFVIIDASLPRDEVVNKVISHVELLVNE